MNKSQMAQIVELDRHVRGRTYPNFSQIHNHYGSAAKRNTASGPAIGFKVAL